MKIGALTIGQSPRVDIIPELEPLLPGVEILEGGALDGLDNEALGHLARRAFGDVLATRLRDGRQIVVGEGEVLPLMNHKIAALEREGVQLLLLLCTGTFADFSASVPVLYPDKILRGITRAVFQGETLGVITPNSQQKSFQVQRWSELVSGRVLVEAVSPYQGDVDRALTRAGERLRQGGAEIIVLDCIGYSIAMRDIIRRTAGVPTLLARTVLARVASEVLTP